MGTLAGLDLTWFELRPVAIEIGEKLRGYYINNVYRAGPLAVVLRLRDSEGHESLLLVHTRRAAWMTRRAPRVQGLDERLRALRERLVRLRVRGAEAVRDERIIEVEADPGRKIYLEFFGAGNIVVVSSGTVEAALNVLEGKARRVIPGAPYELPPRRTTIFEASADQLVEAAAGSSGSLSRALGSKFLAPSKYLEEALWRVGLDKDAPASSVSRRDIERLAEELTRMYAELTQGVYLYLYRGEGLLEVSASRLKRLEELYRVSPELYGSPSEALDVALRDEVEGAASSAGSAEETRRLEEARAQEERARELAARAAELRGIASGLMSGSLGLQDALARLGGEARIDRGRVVLGDLEAPAGSPYALASALYSYAKRLESAAESLAARAAELRAAAGRAAEERGPSEEVVVQERRWFERHRGFYTSGGGLGVGGRGAARGRGFLF